MSDNPRVADIDDVMPGKPLGTKDLEVTPANVHDHMASLGLPVSETGYAPFLLLGTEPWGWPGSYVEYWLGGVAQDMRWISHAPVAIGTRLRAQAYVSDRYIVRNRECSVVTTDLFDEQGRLMLTGSGTYSARVDPDTVRADVPRREAVPKHDPAAGGLVRSGEPRTLRIDREMSQMFWRHRPDIGTGNFHTSLEIAQSMGFADVLIGSSHLAAVAGEQAHALLGDAWLAGGQLTTRFLKPVIGGDDVTVQIDQFHGPDGGTLIQGKMTNQRGETVLAIEGELPSAPSDGRRL
ncbi:MAG: hypothetical protein ABW048_12790 [Sphingobium sp.]